MSTLPTVRTRAQLTQEWIRRFVAYTSDVTWFGSTSVMRAWALATATLAENVYLLYAAMLRRLTLMASSSEYTTQVAAERGVERLGTQAAKVFVIVQPETANVTAITLGATDLIEVDDSSPFLALDSIRIRNGDGTVTDVRTIIAITVGTGPTGGDELEVAVLAGVYNPAVEDVDVLFRAPIPIGSAIRAISGVTFDTVSALTTGDANPILDGESSALGLADKVWCECTTKGDAGNIDPLTVDDFSIPIRGVRAIFNPEPGTGGLEVESDYDLKYRTMHTPTVANQETHTWIEALASAGNRDVLRALKVSTTTLGTLAAKVLHRNGGTFTAAQLLALETYIADRVRSYMAIDLQNVTLTSVEVEATITLEAGATLEEVGKRACDALVVFLDYRKWEWGADVDEADLLSIVNGTEGVASLETSTFLPAADVAVGAESLPTLVRVSLEDADTGLTWNADVAVGF